MLEFLDIHDKGRKSGFEAPLMGGIGEKYCPPILYNVVIHDNVDDDDDDNGKGDDNDRNNSQRTKYQCCVGILSGSSSSSQTFNRTIGKALSRNVKHMLRV